MSTLLKNATIVTGSSSNKGSVLMRGGRIERIYDEGQETPVAEETVDLEGLCLMAGVIDSHVHFREPGMTAKADISSESRAALLGGVTSYIDMPNTNPPAISIPSIESKLQSARGRSYANYGFHIGATADNLSELEAALGDPRVAGIKVFMGSSTGGMLVEGDETLAKIFSLRGKTILVHSEDEGTIRRNMSDARSRFGQQVPFSMHPSIRSREACIRSSARALEMAIKLGTRLHLLHVSTAEEVGMVRAAKIHNPQITAETSANYLWFCDEDYDRLEGRIKCNPAIKGAADREALRAAVAEGIIDTIGSDHAPHLLREKALPYFSCPSGVPSVGNSLEVLLSVAWETGMPLSRVASLTGERPAGIFGIPERGFIREGAIADLVVFAPDEEHELLPEEITYKCGWSPYSGEKFHGRVKMVFLNGKMVVRDGFLLSEKPEGEPLGFISYCSISR